MTSPFVGEIRMFAGTFAPAGWEFCDGQLLPISEYDTLFELIGTTFGGDGEETFALPDLRGRVPLHSGAGAGLTPRTLADSGGAEEVTLTTAHVPAHSHPPGAAAAGATTTSPSGAVWASWPDSPYAAAPDTLVPMHAQAVDVTGGSQPHDNRAPYTTVSFIISLFGVFPST